MPINPEVEYKSLRDEMVGTLNRVFMVLAAEIAVFGTVLARTLGETDPILKAVAFAVVGIFLLFGIALTASLYSHLYMVGSYIVVYLEDSAPGCHMRIRHLRMNFDALKLAAPLGWVHRMWEAYLIGVIYFGMAVLLLLLCGATFGVHSWPFRAQVVLALLSGAGLLWLKAVYRTASGRWTTRWRTYKDRGYEETARKDLGLDSSASGITKG
jgi:hypothetical protein